VNTAMCIPLCGDLYVGTAEWLLLLDTDMWISLYG
jgi:hypothetical protein